MSVHNLPIPLCRKQYVRPIWSIPQAWSSTKFYVKLRRRPKGSVLCSPPKVKSFWTSRCYELKNILRQCVLTALYCSVCRGGGSALGNIRPLINFSSSCLSCKISLLCIRTCRGCETADRHSDTSGRIICVWEI